jgi:ATP-dependent DNA helicase RecG
MDVLQTPIEYLKGVGPSRAHLLKQELNLFTLQDLLHFFPHRYIDRSTFYKIKDLPRNSSEVQILWNWFGLGGINGLKKV